MIHMKTQIFTSLLAAVVLLGCSDDSESPTAPSSLTPATAVSNSTSVDSTLPASDSTLSASDSTLSASDSTLPASDSTLPASDSTLSASDTTLPASDVTLNNTGQLPIRTADASNSAPLTANVLHPGEHDGSPFTVELIFSEPIVTKPQYIRHRSSGSFQISGGRIKKATRQDRERRSDGRRGWVTSHWQLTVEPSGEGTVRIVDRSRAWRRTRCAGSSALCTEDGRILSHRLDFTIRGLETGQANTPAGPGPIPNLTVTHNEGFEYILRWERSSNTSNFHVWAGAYHTQIERCRTGPTTGPSWKGPFPSLSGSNGVTTYTLVAHAGRGGGRDPEDWPVFSVQAIQGSGRFIRKGPCTSANVFGPVSSEANYVLQ